MAPSPKIASLNSVRSSFLLRWDGRLLRLKRKSLVLEGGRETKGEAVLVRHLLAALERLNAYLPRKPFGAIDQLICDRSVMSLATANWGAYCFLKDGNPVSIWDAMLLCQVTVSSDSHACA